MITVIDSAISNLGSVRAALTRIGASHRVTAAPAEVAAADALLLPGVGAFGDGMAALRRRGLVEPIREHAAAGKPILGICLGMQLLADSSEEFGEHEGLGLIPGRIRRLHPAPGLRVPNIGWCDVRVAEGARLFEDVPDGAPFYFVHSYVVDCDDPANSVGTIAFGDADETVVLQRKNIYGAQFHPEKSQDAGLCFLDSFARIVSGARRIYGDT